MSIIFIILMCILVPWMMGKVAGKFNPSDEGEE